MDLQDVHIQLHAGADAHLLTYRKPRVLLEDLGSERSQHWYDRQYRQGSMHLTTRPPRDS